MNFLRTFLVCLLVTGCSHFSSPEGYDQMSSELGDSVTPARILLATEPGDSFQRTIKLQSPQGGIFQTRIQPFRLAVDGSYEYVYDQPLDFISLSDDSFELDPGDSFDLELRGEIPPDYFGGDASFYVFVRGEPRVSAGLPQQVELGVKVLLRVGDLEGDILGQVVSGPKIAQSSEGVIDRVSVEYKNTGPRFYSVQSELSFMTSDDTVQKRFFSTPFQLLPGQTYPVFAMVFGEENMVVSDDVRRVVFSITSENGEVMEAFDLSIRSGDIFRGYRPELEYQGVAFRDWKPFSWTDLLPYFIFILMGLSLVAYALYPSKD